MTVIADAPGAPIRLRLATDTPRRWQDAALCAEVDPDLFFPEKGESIRAPKQVCAACPVRAQCLEYALEHEVGRWGVWGGTTWAERRTLQQQRRAA